MISALGLLMSSLAACSSEQPPSKPAITDPSGRISSLVCPGGPGCASNSGTLTVGVAKRIITPTIESWMELDGDGRQSAFEPYEDLNGNGRWDGVWIAGFGNGRAARGVHDDNWVRVLTFTQGDLRLGVVSLDLIGYFHDEVVRVRQAAEAAGLDFDHILVASTHQHEGRDTMGIWGESPVKSGIDREYMARIIQETVEALAEASRNEVAVRLELVQTELPELIADSREPQVIDPVATAVRFLDPSDALRATLVVWGNHPETLGDSNTLITSDYPHYLRERLEQEAPGSTALFFAGTLGGLMNPLDVAGCPDAVGEPTCSNGDFRKAEWMGEGVASAVLEAFGANGVLRDAAPTLSFRRERIFLPVQNRRFIIAFSAGILDRALYSPEGEKLSKLRLAQLTFEELAALGISVQSEVNALRIGPLELLTVPGELYPELWLTRADGTSFVEFPANADFPDARAEPALRTLMPDAPMRAIVNQANDAVGYVIPKPQFDDTAPYAYRDSGQYGEENSLGPDAASKIAEGVVTLYQRAP